MSIVTLVEIKLYMSLGIIDICIPPYTFDTDIFSAIGIDSAP